MLRHIAMFRFVNGADPGAVARLTAALDALPAAIPEIVAYELGPDLALSDGSWDFAVVGDFADIDGWRTYRDHPVHRAVIGEHLAPLLADRAVVQLEVPGVGDDAIDRDAT